MKLLTKTIRYYLYLSLPLFLISSIGFYFFLKQVMIHQVDESLNEDKIEIEGFVNNKKDDVTELYKNITCSYYLKEIPADKEVNETYSFVYDLDTLENEIEPYRELRSSIVINDLKYELVLQESFVESDSMIYSISIFSIFLFAFLSLGISIVNWRISKRIWLPFYGMIRLIGEFEPDLKNQKKFEGGKVLEFKKLSDSLNIMTKRVSKVFFQQKKFIDNVAHELQTPLAVASTQIELLIQKVDFNEQSAELINDLDNTIIKMKNMNNSLLLLSRIENEQFENNETIELSDIVGDYLEMHNEQIEMMDLDVTTTQKDKLKVSMNPVLAEILVGNLIRNAIVHNEDSGYIIIKINNSDFEISNPGINLEIDTETLFNKYVHYGKSSNSTGLGLSIVKEICNYYGFQVRYKITGNIHTVKIQFKTLDSL